MCLYKPADLRGHIVRQEKEGVYVGREEESCGAKLARCAEHQDKGGQPVPIYNTHRHRSAGGTGADGV